MGMRKHIRAVDVAKIKKHVRNGHECQTISQALGITYDRVADIITSIEPAKQAAIVLKESQAAEKEMERCKNLGIEYTPPKKKRKRATKDAIPATPTAPITVKASSMPAPIPGSIAIT